MLCKCRDKATGVCSVGVVKDLQAYAGMVRARQDACRCNMLIALDLQPSPNLHPYPTGVPAYCGEFPILN